MLNTAYFYNGKLFGLCGDKHRYITVANVELGSNFIPFEGNVAKSFHSGLTDLKYEPRVVKHVCHPLIENDESCLVELYRMYIGLVHTRKGYGLKHQHFTSHSITTIHSWFSTVTFY